MKKSIKKNYIYNLSYQLLAIILPIITTPYLARVLGANGNGIYGYTLSIVTYFILFGSLGITVYGQREIAYVQNDDDKKNKLFTELVIFRLITMILSSIMFFVIFGIGGKYSIYYRILLLEMFANAIDISWLYQGLEEFKKIVLRNFIIKILSVICIFLFIKTKNDVSKYIAIFSLTTLLGNASLWFKFNKYAKFDFKSLNLTKHIRPTLLLFIPQVAIQIYTVLDKTMLGTILNDMSEVGYYEQSQKVIKILLTVITSLGIVMLPRIANCFSEGNTNQINKYMKKSFSFVFFLGFPMIFGIIAVSNNFVPLFFGAGYKNVIPMLSIMSILMLFIGISNIIGNQYLLPTKKQNQYTVSVIIGACVNFIFNFILIAKFKSFGAVIATIIAEFCVMFIQLIFANKYLNIKSYLKLGIKYLISSLLMFIVCLIIGYFIDSNIYSLVIKTTCGGIIYIFILYLLKDEFLLETLENFKRIIKR